MKNKLLSIVSLFLAALIALASACGGGGDPLPPDEHDDPTHVDLDMKEMTDKLNSDDPAKRKQGADMFKNAMADDKGAGGPGAKSDSASDSAGKDKGKGNKKPGHKKHKTLVGDAIDGLADFFKKATGDKIDVDDFEATYGDIPFPDDVTLLTAILINTNIKDTKRAKATALLTKAFEKQFGDAAAPPLTDAAMASTDDERAKKAVAIPMAGLKGKKLADALKAGGFKKDIATAQLASTDAAVKAGAEITLCRFITAELSSPLTASKGKSKADIDAAVAAEVLTRKAEFASMVATLEKRTVAPVDGDDFDVALKMLVKYLLVNSPKEGTAAKEQLRTMSFNQSRPASIRNYVLAVSGLDFSNI